jgi:AmiR/NasT family two-component response regulator
LTAVAALCVKTWAKSSARPEAFLRFGDAFFLLAHRVGSDPARVEAVEVADGEVPPLTVPVVIVSGNSDPLMAEAARALGAVDYVTKPFALERLTQAVELVLGPPS